MASTAVPASLDPALPAPERSRRPWQAARWLSSVADAAEAFLAARPFERGQWLVVAFALGIAAWFVLPDANRWLAWLAEPAACG